MFAKAERMSIREFMKKDDRTTMKGTELKISDIIERVNDPKVKRILATTTTIIVITKFGPLAALPAIAAQFAQPEAVPAAALSESIRLKIVHAFDPLIEVVKALSYPIAAVMITAGCLFIMVGNKEKGMSMIQMAGIGYILVQLAPVFMQILVGIGGVV